MSFSSSSSSMNLEERVSMDLVTPPDQSLCYVRCNFCNTVLAVGIPSRRLLDTVTVKCGHCSNLSFLSTRPPLQGQCLDHPTSLPVFCSDFKKGQSSSSAYSISDETLSMSTTKPPFVVKPPEKKHRLPSAYNRFMKEEIQRIKAGNPEIPHREAFSAAAKNVSSQFSGSHGFSSDSIYNTARYSMWARYIPNTPTGSISESSNNA